MPSKLKMHVSESRVDWAPWRYIIEKQGRVWGGGDTVLEPLPPLSVHKKKLRAMSGNRNKLALVFW